jgi:hypothetical protein
LEQVLSARRYLTSCTLPDHGGRRKAERSLVIGMGSWVRHTTTDTPVLTAASFKGNEVTFEGFPDRSSSARFSRYCEAEAYVYRYITPLISYSSLIIRDLENSTQVRNER